MIFPTSQAVRDARSLVWDFVDRQHVLFDNIINPELLIGSLLRTRSQETSRDKVMLISDR